MAHAELPGPDQDLYLSRKIEQSQQVGDMGPGLVDELAELLLGMAIVVDQALVGLRLLDRVEVLPLDILDQSDFECLVVAELADDRRYVVQPRPLGRAPAPFAGDDLEAVAMRADDDRLDHAARLDGGGELGQSLLGEDPAGLARVITFASSRKARNLLAAQGSRAAVSQVDGGRWITLEGPAVVTDDPDRVAEAVRRYTERYREPSDRPDRVAIEITVDRVLGRA